LNPSPARWKKPATRGKRRASGPVPGPSSRRFSRWEVNAGLSTRATNTDRIIAEMIVSENWR
jgi:hypothetical protein